MLLRPRKQDHPEDSAKTEEQQAPNQHFHDTWPCGLFSRIEL
jgi:hypothetical protein